MLKPVLLVLLMCTGAVYGKNTKVTIYVEEAFKPFSYLENGKPRGLYIDILKAVFRKMPNFEVTLIAVPWDRGKKIMEDGKGFALASPFFHAHDWTYLYPYSLSYFTEKIIVVCSESVLQVARPNWPQDFYSLRIGGVAGYDGWGGNTFRNAIRNELLIYSEARDAASLIKMLLKGRQDCILTEDLLFDVEIAKLQHLKSFDQLYKVQWKKGQVIGEDSVYLGYSETALKKGRYPFAYEFQKQFDTELYRLKKSGELQRIISSYRMAK